MRDIEKIIHRKKQINNLIPRTSYAGILEIVKVILLFLLVLKQFGVL